ncbi:MAG: putative DNA-binding domain-containing protein [Deltaproteobacteria bacterium]|nr:putative DNA-binding domain-containing protein [Deltaproteobacteria bacterium]
MSELEEIQRRFLSLVREPSGVAKGLEALRTNDPGIAPVSGWIRGRDEAEAIKRLDVYANMYFFRLLDILKGDFPRVLAVLGDVGFHNLVTEYLLVHPSRDPSVRNIGRPLPSFLRTHASTKDRPWIAEVAELEWGWTEVFDAENEEILTEAHLAALAPEAWLELELRTIRAARVYDLEYPVHTLIGATQAGFAPEAPIARRCSVLLFRRDFAVRYREMPEAERSIFDQAQKGVSFPLVCEYLARPEDHDVMAVAGRARDLLQAWLFDGLLVVPSGAAKDVTRPGESRAGVSRHPGEGTGQDREHEAALPTSAERSSRRRTV